MGTGRPLKADTPLAERIRADGRTAYLIAALAGLGQDQVSRYCNGTEIPFMHRLRLASVLGCDPSDLEGKGGAMHGR